MRQHGWDKRLFEYIEAQKQTRFEWGTFDCCLFAAACVEAMTGVDFAKDLRGYKTQADAYAVIAKYGSIQAMVTSLLGKEPIHPAFAQRGDLLLAIQPDGREVLRICLGIRSAMPSENGVGLAFPSLNEARFAWRI